MKILFCGNFVDEKYNNKIKYLSLAGNRFQNNLFKALNKTKNIVDKISYIGIPLETEIAEELKKDEDIIIKQTEGEKCFISFRKLCKEKIDNSDIVIAYNQVYMWLFLPIYAKKKNKKSILVLADYSGVESYSNIVYKLYSWLQLKTIQKYDIIIGLSRDCKRFLKPNQKFIHMEGGLNIEDFSLFSLPENKDELVVMYAGLQSKVTGIDLLVEAFDKIDCAKLVITGQPGDLTEWIESKAARNDNICFYGKVEYEKYQSLLQEANILINPRNMNMYENKNNFPSKILEYLATGRVIISTKFVGYDKFIDNCIFAESTVESLRKNIEEAVRDYPTVYQDVFKKNVEKSKQYDWDLQVKRILKNSGEEA